MRGKLGKETQLKNWSINPSTKEGDSSFQLDFDWEDDIGIPGAFLITNRHHKEFYLKTLTLEQLPNNGSGNGNCNGRLHFICNSWVYPEDKYDNHYRVFFSNQVINNLPFHILLQTIKKNHNFTCFVFL